MRGPGSGHRYEKGRNRKMELGTPIVIRKIGNGIIIEPERSTGLHMVELSQVMAFDRLTTYSDAVKFLEKHFGAKAQDVFCPLLRDLPSR
jgi:hypothetical protein